jgi:hypothetical protein
MASRVEAFGSVALRSLMKAPKPLIGRIGGTRGTTTKLNVPEVRTQIDKMRNATYLARQVSS